MLSHFYKHLKASFNFEWNFTHFESLCAGRIRITKFPLFFLYFLFFLFCLFFSLSLKQMPLVHPGFSQVSNIRPSLYGVYVRPPYLSAINDVIRFHDWKGVIYLYDSDDGKGTQFNFNNWLIWTASWLIEWWKMRESLTLPWGYFCHGDIDRNERRESTLSTTSVYVSLFPSICSGDATCEEEEEEESRKNSSSTARAIWETLTWVLGVMSNLDEAKNLN